jgi:integrase
MGAIAKRDDKHGKPTYQAKIRKAGFPAQSKTFTTRKDAERWIVEREAEMSRGTFVDTKAATTMTLRQAIERYIEEVTPRKRSAEQEKPRLRAMARSDMAAHSLANLTPKEVAKWRDERLKEVSGATVHRNLAILRHVIQIARKEWGIAIPTNPVSEISMPKVSNARERRLTTDEEKALLAACAQSRNTFLIDAVTLALETGMRQSEIVGLDWRHVDLTKRVAHLPITKNGSSRNVPLSSKAIEVLKSRPCEEVNGLRTGKVFESVTPEAVKRAFIRACTRAGLENLRFHDLRHEATSRFFEKGFQIMEVSTITGHKTLSMLKRYTHLSAEELAKRL